MRKNQPNGDHDRNIIRQQWKTYSIAQKIKYIFSYYGIAILIAVIGMCAAVFLVRNILQEKTEEAFFVMALESELDEATVESMTSGLTRTLGLDEDTQQCILETGYSGAMNAQNEATISTYMQSGRVDLVIAPEEDFNRYACSGYLCDLTEPEWNDLTECFTDDELFYASLADYSEGAVNEFPFHPHEKTEDSGLYGIYLAGEEFDGYVIGIMVNAPHGERVQAGLRYFLNGTK